MLTSVSLARRQFLQFLAGSPLLAQAQQKLTPKEALNVMDFESAARQTLPPAHFGYLATGVDDDATLQANREGFQRIQLRPRRLVDVRSASLATELFGTAWETPIVIAPCGSQKAFHPDGELATARAARSKKTLQILSTVTTCRIEDVTEAAGYGWRFFRETARTRTRRLALPAFALACGALHRLRLPPSLALPYLNLLFRKR